MASDPPYTIAISRNYIMASETGFGIIQYCDGSKNEAAKAELYNLSQEGDHSSSPSDSGKVVLSLSKDGKFQVYAMNLGMDARSNAQIGLKMENVLLYWSVPVYTSPTISARPYFRYQMVLTPHGFRVSKSITEVTETQEFLKSVGKARGEYKSVPTPAFISKATEIVTYTPHQMAHMGTDRSKTRFYYFTNDADYHFQSLALIIQKAVSHMLQKGHKEVFAPAIQRPKDKMQERPTPDMAFYVNLGFPIGFCRHTNKETSWVFVEDPIGGLYHFYPNGIPESGSSKPGNFDLWLDLPVLLDILVKNEAKK